MFDSVNPDKYDPKADSDLLQLNKADVDNHNKDGAGLWVVIHDRVYDVEAFRAHAPCGSDFLEQYISESRGR